MLKGLMQDWPLTVDRLIRHGERHHPRVPVITRTAGGDLRRTPYAEIGERARAVSRALVSAGIGAGDRVATLAWNSDRHVELWYGIGGIGAVCHPFNPRLSAEQIAWICNHAQDRLVFVDIDLLPTLEAIAPLLRAVPLVVVLTDGAALPATALDAVTLDAFLGAAVGMPTPAWGDFDENAAGTLFYTSGTTGDPKGVLYSHRSSVLHALMFGLGFGFPPDEVAMPIVPMFHANGWGLPHLGPALGIPLVMPGAAHDPASLFSTMEEAGVTMAAGVPTIWTKLLGYLRREGRSLSTLRRVFSGGAATPAALIQAYAAEQGVRVQPTWGMTELSPAGTWNAEPMARDAVDVRQGRFMFGVEAAITAPDGSDAPWDGRTAGALKVRGPAIVARYYGADADALDEDGWFDTGDVATIHPDAVLEITDRAKDVIKSGGEWISSATIEQVASSHPSVELCAAIAVPDDRWDERPLLLVQVGSDTAFDGEDVRAYLSSHLPKWWVPERVVRVDALPLGATGKVDKKVLRAEYAPSAKPA